MSKPRLLDLFCGAGGAAMGYHRAGFEVVGVDIEPQPNYPFEFFQADAFEVFGEFADLRTVEYKGYVFDAIHVSPPCQAFSSLKARTQHIDHPALIEPTRELLKASGLPYVIENVVGAPLIDPIQLCGSAFGIGVRRHRRFECSFSVMALSCSHSTQPRPLDVTGTGGRRTSERQSNGGNSRKPRSLLQAQRAMGINWMTRRELSQAIPPVYTEHIGQYLMQYLEHESHRTDQDPIREPLTGRS